jgi:hypothetical protein
MYAVYAGEWIFHAARYVYPHLLWPTLWINRDKISYPHDLKGNFSIDQNQGMPGMTPPAK